MVNKRESAAKAERAFKLFDKDNDGYITKVEFQKISEKLDKSQVPKENVAFEIGFLYFTEYYVVFIFIIYILLQHMLKCSKNIYGQKTLLKSFYLQMHNATNSNISTQIQIDAIYKKFDKDNDGVLSLAEFKKMMNRENPE